MLANEFMQELSVRLSALAPQERDKALSYYEELISDKLENGEDEEEIISGFGNLYELTKAILAENNITNISQKKSIHPAIIIGLIIGSPIIFAVIVTVASLVFALLVTGFAIAFSFLAIGLSFFIISVLTFIFSFALIINNPMIGFLQIGVSFVSLGLGILFAIAGMYIGKAVWIGVKFMTNKMKQQFAKGGNQYE